VLNALTILILCQFAGEVLARGAGLPLPGPVLGLLILLVWLVLRDRAPDPALRQTGGWLLAHFGLLFVPAGVGVVTQLGVLRAAWLPLLVAIPISTFLGLLVTGWVMQKLARPEPSADPLGSVGPADPSGSVAPAPHRGPAEG
jgi:holin-like protein